MAVGKRIFLRRPVPQDRREYLALRRRSASFLRPWEPRPSGTSAAVRLFAAWLSSARSGRSEKLLLCSKEDGAILGAINLNEIVRGPAQSAYLGYWIGAPYETGLHDRGPATRLASCVPDPRAAPRGGQHHAHEPVLARSGDTRQLPPRRLLSAVPEDRWSLEGSRAMGPPC
jgi:GNAT acetyltransferase-like protein